MDYYVRAKGKILPRMTRALGCRCHEPLPAVLTAETFQGDRSGTHTGSTGTSVPISCAHMPGSEYKADGCAKIGAPDMVDLVGIDIGHAEIAASGIARFEAAGIGKRGIEPQHGIGSELVAQPGTDLRRGIYFGVLGDIGEENTRAPVGLGNIGRVLNERPMPAVPRMAVASDSGTS